MEILEVIIDIGFAVDLIIGFVFVVFYLVRKDEKPEFRVSIKEYSILGLFVLPITEIMFVLGAVNSLLINDLPLVIFDLIFIVSLPIFMFYAIRILKENKKV